MPALQDLAHFGHGKFYCYCIVCFIDNMDTKDATFYQYLLLKDINNVKSFLLSLSNVILSTHNGNVGIHILSNYSRYYNS